MELLAHQLDDFGERVFLLQSLERYVLAETQIAQVDQRTARAWNRGRTVVERVPAQRSHAGFAAVILAEEVTGDLDVDLRLAGLAVVANADGLDGDEAEVEIDRVVERDRLLGRIDDQREAAEIDAVEERPGFFETVIGVGIGQRGEAFDHRAERHALHFDSQHLMAFGAFTGPGGPRLEREAVELQTEQVGLLLRYEGEAKRDDQVVELERALDRALVDHDRGGVAGRVRQHDLVQARPVNFERFRQQGIARGLNAAARGFRATLDFGFRDKRQFDAEHVRIPA